MFVTRLSLCIVIIGISGAHLASASLQNEASIRLGSQIQAGTEKQMFFFCQYHDLNSLADYYSDVFPGKQADSVAYAQAFYHYLDAHYRIGQNTQALCFSDDGRSAARSLRDSHEADDKRSGRKIVETGWGY